MSAQLRIDRLHSMVSGEERKVQVGNGSLPLKTRFKGHRLDLNDDKKVESSEESVKGQSLADAKAERKTELLNSPSFQRTYARRKLDLSKIQRGSGEKKVPTRVRRSPEPRVPISGKTKDERLEHQLTAMLSEIEVLKEKFYQSEEKLRQSEQDNQDLRSSMSGSSDSQGGDNVNVNVLGFTPTPNVIGDTNVDTVRSHTPAPLVHQTYVTREKYCDGTPNVAKVDAIIKSFKKALTLKNASDWDKYKRRIEDVCVEQMFDLTLIDITQVWDHTAPETLLARRRRVELYKIIVGTIEQEHADKIDTPVCLEHRHNVNVVWRTIEQAFNDQYKKCDVGNRRKTFVNCTMVSTGKAVVEYGLELERRLQKLQEIGISTNVIIELIPHYLNGLSDKFSNVIDYIRRSMREQPTRFDTLQKVRTEVEYQAAHLSLLNFKPKIVLNQNLAQSDGSKSKSDGSKSKSNGSKSNAVTPKVDKRATMPCHYGDNCQRNSCAFQHPKDREEKLLESSDKKTDDSNSTTITNGVSTGVSTNEEEWKIVASFQTSVIQNENHGLTETSDDDGICIVYCDSSDQVDSENENDSVPELQEGDDDRYLSGPGPVVKLSIPVEGRPRELDDNDESGDTKNKSDPSEIQGEQKIVMVVPSKMYTAVYDLNKGMTDTKVLAPWYGLNEDAKISHNQFVKVIKDCGIKENPWLPKTFYKWKNEKEFIILGQKLDDVIIKGTSWEMIDETLDQIDKKLKFVRNYGPKKIQDGRDYNKLHSPARHQELLELNQNFVGGGNNREDGEARPN